MALLLFWVLLLPLSAQASWIDASNRIAEEYALADGENFPERASAMGYRQFDSRGLHLEKDGHAAETAFLRSWVARLGRELAKSGDPQLSLDLRILRDHLRLRIEEIRLNEKFGVVSFLPGTRFVLESLLALVNEQSGAERKAAAAARFHEYVHGSKGRPPFLAALRNRIISDEIRFQKKRLMPLQGELDQYLAESPEYLRGLADLLAKTGGKSVGEDLALFAVQAQEFDAFVRTHLLSGSRQDFRLPKEIYAHRLRMRGIESSAEDLIRLARKEYRSLYGKFRAVARLVAKAEGLKFAEPAEVIRHLKRRQVLKPELVKPLFEQANRTLEEIIRREQLVTLPKAPLRIRVAGEAESLANPVPHLNEPPIIGNQGERPEFVIPSFASGKSQLDDFSYEAAALVLSAHEGRPGHDLQFSTMLDKGTSIVRARYAFNNANVEGWGLYAEELVYPYLPLPAQLVALQMRLIRVARAFLDPEVQLGKIATREVPRFLQKELGISEPLARLELRRFQFDNPGQAPSYFYGLTRMTAAKRRLSSSLGKRYNDRCFHDGVLALGMLPVGLIGAELERSLKCGKSTARLNP